MASIMGSLPVATRGRRTKGRLRWLLSTELCQSRKSANDGSIVGRSKLASFDHLVVAGEQRMRHAEAERLHGREVCSPTSLRRLLSGQVHPYETSLARRRPYSTSVIDPDFFS